MDWHTNLVKYLVFAITSELVPQFQSKKFERKKNNKNGIITIDILQDTFNMYSSNNTDCLFNQHCFNLCVNIATLLHKQITNKKYNNIDTTGKSKKVENEKYIMACINGK